MTKFKLSINSEVREFKVTQQDGKIIVDDGTKTAVFQSIHTENPPYLLEWLQENGSRQQIQLAGYKERDSRQLWINGRTFKANRVREHSANDPSSDTSLSTTIPAVVSQILVNIGAQVHEGDKLILLESMKMVIPIQAPYDGTVTALHCTNGESVQAGIQLIQITKNQT